MSSNYFIAVAIATALPAPAVASALQGAFDNGTAGFFQVVPTPNHTCMVIIERQAGDDADMVSSRLHKDPSLTMKHHARQQLAAELYEANEAPVDSDNIVYIVAQALESGTDQMVFDFGSTALADLTTTPGQSQ